MTTLITHTRPDGAPPGHRSRSPRLVLAVVCLAVLTILVDTTLVNVALPTLARDLGASNTGLQWIVDAYNLAFAALVLAAGSVSDRVGRKGALMLGLAVFGVATALGSAATSTAALIVARGAMGVGAAMVFPNTLSIIANVFPGRTERAAAIGVWGAASGVGIALGPIVGGLLVERYWWGSAFLGMAPLAALSLVLVAIVVPPSQDPAVPPLDWFGLVASTVTIGLAVHAIIEAPNRGWSTPTTLGELAAAALAGIVFLAWERRTPSPMLDVRLFANLRFTAASGSVTVASFTLFGFIFMITMYFQFMHGYSPLGTGVRTLPVAITTGIASLAGTALAVRIGNKVIVGAGLSCMAIGFAWISQSSAATPYLETVGQMVVTAAGMGLTSAPATEAIMGVVPAAKAGIGSAMNDATRELGGTLGVAVIGSVFASLYAGAIRGTAAFATLAPDDRTMAEHSVGGALLAARRVATTDRAASRALADAVEHAFFSGFEAGCLTAAAVAAAGAVAAFVLLPAEPL